MKEITAILLLIIAIIGIISIIIVKIYYKDKEKDEEKERLEEFINSTKSDYEEEKHRKVRRAVKKPAEFSEAQLYAKTINSQSKEDIKDARRVRRAIAYEDPSETENAGGTAALLRQRAKAMENAPKKQVRRVRKPQAEAANIPKRQTVNKKVPRTPQRVKTQMNKEEEVKSFQEPIKPVHTATINSARQKDKQPKARQVPMTEKQKEFIAKDTNKLIVEDSDSAVKVVKSVKPADSIEEIKESAKIEDKTVNLEEKDNIVEKAEKDTAELIKKIEEAKSDVEDKLAETKKTAEKEATESAEEAVKEKLVEAEAKETVQEKLVEAKEEVKDKTPTLEDTIEKIKQASSEKDETAEDKTEEVKAEEAKIPEAKATETISEASKIPEAKATETISEASKIPEAKATETISEASKIPEAKATETISEASKIPEAKVEEAKEEVIPETKSSKETEIKLESEVAITPENKAEEAKSAIAEGASKVSEKISQVKEKVYNDDLHLILNKEEKPKLDETPENEFVTINPDNESNSGSNELISNAIKSIRNFRKTNVPEEPVIEEIKDDVIPDDYAQDLGNGIEYIGDTITITPIHEEEIDLANNQPNEDVDKIYEEINKKPYNKTDDDELSESFEDVSDETSEKDANVYSKEDYKKIEAKEKEKKRRSENTKRILGSKGISEEELKKKAEAKAKSKRIRKAASADEPVEEGQKRLMVHKTKNDVEEVYINGTLFELKVGQIVIYEIKGETYSSQILRLKPGFIGVRYRSKKIWVKSNSVKKILK